LGHFGVKTSIFPSKTLKNTHFPIKNTQKHPFSNQKHPFPLKNTHFPIKNPHFPIKKPIFLSKNRYFLSKIRYFTGIDTVLSPFVDRELLLKNALCVGGKKIEQTGFRFVSKKNGKK
jgi:hypothetical protein